jgi:hypothetical protein
MGGVKSGKGEVEGPVEFYKLKELIFTRTTPIYSIATAVLPNTH